MRGYGECIERTCKRDSNCPVALRCEFELCVPRTCHEDGECGGRNRRCIAGKCKYTPPCEIETGCANPNEICHKMTGYAN